MLQIILRRHVTRKQLMLLAARRGQMLPGMAALARVRPVGNLIAFWNALVR
jgi:hypothetical protein